jgi:hypothetical protein
MRTSFVLNAVLLVAVTHFATAFLWNHEEEWFAGRSVQQWQPVSGSEPRLMLERRRCSERDCTPQVRLLLSRGDWDRLKSACFPNPTEPICFAGPRLGFVADAPHRSVGAVELRWRDGTVRQFRFASPTAD